MGSSNIHSKSQRAGCPGYGLERFSEKADHGIGGLFSGFQDFVVVEGGGGDAGGPVGEAGEGDDGQSERAGLDGFEDGAHADGIGPEGAEHADLGRGFILRAAESGVNAFVEGHAEVGGGGADRGAPCGIVGVGEVNEIGPEQR